MSSLTNDIQRAIIKAGIPCERIQAGRVGRVRMAKKGTPDLVTPLGFLEVKRPEKGDKPKPHQLKWHEEWRRWGARVAVVHGIEEALEQIREWRNGELFDRAMGWDTR
jgi:hypothetical protein